MCGIAGRVNLASGAPVDPAVVGGMCDLLAHRGPDGDGVLVSGIAGLGHRRLAIIDLSEAGRQPMSTDDQRYWISFNGEIYNFLELRAELEGRGYRFRSRTDTEVVLALYSHLGTGCVTRLRGMFALAIWDAVDRTLFLARDRLGKKPLYYRLDRDGLAFASEPKAFLAEPSYEPRPDLAAIGEYLSYQYVPAPRSAFEGVTKLPPAHWLLYREGRVTVERYWRLAYAPKRTLTEDQAVEELLHRLRDAVRLRLISDVPLGAFLSGGVDSGTIVALMAGLGQGAVKTFSIGFEEEAFDELSYARLVARRYATDHHEFVVRPDALAIIPKLAWHYNEPFADSSAIPSFYLSELTRRHVTVALNGDGGDENFAGYDRYVHKRRNQLYGQAPASLRRALARAAAAGRAASGSPSRAASWLARMARPAEERHVAGMMQFDAHLKRDVCTPEFLEAAGGADSSRTMLDAYAAHSADDFLDATLAADVETYLPGALLAKVDIATMAYGLEGRSPLLDHEFMEFAATLPPSFKLRGAVKKYIFKKAARTLLPADILDRPKKGFSVPLAQWFRGELKPLVHDVLLGRDLAGRGILKPEALRRIVNEHESGRRDWQAQIWNVLMLEQWFLVFIDRAARGDRQSAMPFTAQPSADSTRA